MNIKNNERLNTEELFWNPTDEEIYTEKFVRIETEDQILLGQGLTADQDFSTYKIEKLTGELTIDDQDNWCSSVFPFHGDLHYCYPSDFNFGFFVFLLDFHVSNKSITFI